MAAYSALLADVHSVGTSLWAKGPTDVGRTSPDAVVRIPHVLAPHVVMDQLGGFVSADFTIPVEYARQCAGWMKYGVIVWLFDGNTPCFYGVTDYGAFAQQPDGSVEITASGTWALLNASRMREAWDMRDMTQWTAAPGNVQAGSAELNSNGNVRFSLQKGSNYQTGDFIALDYMLFNEPVGTRDQKLIMGFDLDALSGDYQTSGSLEFRVYGLANPADNTPVLLYHTTGAAPFSVYQTSTGSSWPNTNGYRCLRVGIWVTGTITGMSGDRNLTLSEIRVGSQASLFPTDTNPLSTVQVVKATLGQRQNSVLDVLDIAPEFWRDTSIGDPMLGLIKDSNIPVGGVTFLDWTAPQEILTQMSTVDGYRCGTYFPINPRSGYSSPDGGAGRSSWLSTPPRLTYEPWPDLSSPEYLVFATRGALLEPNTNPQPLLGAVYVNYQTAQGRQRSVYTTQTTAGNYVYQQGFRRAEDYSIGPTVDQSSYAASLGQAELSSRGDGLQIGKVTITSDMPGSITLGTGPWPRLSQIRPGVVKIPDLKATHRAGRATHVEWWGRTDQEPTERVELTLTPQSQMNLARRLARAAWIADHQRSR